MNYLEKQLKAFSTCLESYIKYKELFVPTEDGEKKDGKEVKFTRIDAERKYFSQSFLKIFLD